MQMQSGEFQFARREGGVIDFGGELLFSSCEGLGLPFGFAGLFTAPRRSSPPPLAKMAGALGGLDSLSLALLDGTVCTIEPFLL